MTEITFENLITDVHSVIYKILRSNIPSSTVRHITDGYSTELKNNVEYPHIQVNDPDSSIDVDNHKLDFTTLHDIPIEVSLKIYTLTAKERREVIDLVQSTIMKNLTTSQVTDYDTLNNYGLTEPTFSMNNSSPALIPNDDAGRYEYVTEITVTFHWSGASI